MQHLIGEVNDLRALWERDEPVAWNIGRLKEDMPQRTTAVGEEPGKKALAVS